MAKDIVQLNIERFRRLLAETTDESQRQIIERLLAEEEAKMSPSSSGGDASRPRVPRSEASG
jgi:hypothetical protein